MDQGVGAVVVAAGLLALAVFAALRWRERRRARRVTAWVTDFLTCRDGGPPARLSVYCTADGNWPVLASFDDARTSARHRLQFACGGRPETHFLLTEVVDDGKG